MHQVDRDQVRQDVEFVLYISGHIVDYMCDENVFKVFRSGYYPDEKEKQIEYFLKNLTDTIAVAAAYKGTAEQYADERILRSFPKNIREGNTKPELKPHEVEAKKKIMEYFEFMKDEIEKAREEGRISF